MSEEKRIDSQYVEAVESVLNGMGSLRMDANETNYTARMLESVKSVTYDVLYAALKSRDLVPIDTSMPSWSESITYQQYDAVGTAKIIETNADDLPNVGVFLKEFTQKVKSLGVSYDFTRHDLRAASVPNGRPIKDQKSRAAGRAMAQKFDDLIALGDSAYNYEGCLNNSSVNILAATGVWSGLSSLQLLADLDRMANTVRNQSEELFEVDTIVLPGAQYDLVVSTPMSVDNTVTVGSTFTSRTGVNLVRWNKAAGAGAGSVDRAWAYARTPEVLQANIPMMAESLPEQDRNLSLVVNVEGRYGGVEVHYPVGMVYMDTI